MKRMQKLRVKNALGLHTRPAAMIVQLLHTRKSAVSFTCRGMTVNAKSILSLLTLAASKNCLLTITVEGEDAEETMDHLVALFEERFGE